MTENPVSRRERLLLDEIVDHLIPGNREKSIPGAGEAGVAGYLVQVATERSDFDIALRGLLTRAEGLDSGINPANIRRLEREMPEEFIEVLTETYKGYYSLPELRAKVGVGAHPVHPKGYEVARESAELLDSLTEPVRARGPIYRDSGAVGDG